MSRPKISGIYKITCKANNVCYIGQSVDIDSRLTHHKRALRNNTHKNKYLQGLYNKYGATNFTYEIIETCPITELDAKERYWIGYYGGVESKRNCNFESGGHATKFYNNEYKDAKSKKYKGIGLPNGEPTRFPKGHQPWNKGKATPPEIRAKLSKAHTGLKVSEQTKRKISKTSKGLITGKDRYNSVRVYMYNKDMELIKEFECIKHALDFINVHGNRHIKRHIINGKLYHGYYWKREKI